MLGMIGLVTALLATPVQFTWPPHTSTAQQYPETKEGLSCAPKVLTPQVDIRSERKEPTFTYSESTADLTQLSAAGGTYRPPGATGPSWHTGGLTQAMVDYKYNVPAYVIPDPNLGCVIIKTITLDIVLTPQVWVANDYAPGTCMYNAVHEHEMKHVNVDRAVADRHLPQIHAALIKFSQNRGFLGPGSESEMKVQYDQYVKDVGNVIKSEIDKMEMEDSRMQQQVDTLQEYERINHLCATQLREMGR